MLPTFLFIVFLSIYAWLYSKPRRTSNQHPSNESADLTATTPSQITPTSPNAEASSPAATLQPDREEATIQIVDKRTPIPNPSLSIVAEETTVKTQSAVIEEVSSKSEPLQALEELLTKKHLQAGEETSTSDELELDADIELEPALTEEEAIALAIETNLAKDTTMEVLAGEIEDSVPKLMRPKPPDPELVEAAVRDAEEKLEDFSPPEIAHDASQVRL